MQVLPDPTVMPTMRSKTYYMVPIQWSDDFTGREEILQVLSSKLCQTDKNSRVALEGLGGVGKTRIALQFAVQYQKSQEVSVFWVNVGNAERLKKSYLDIAKEVKITRWSDSNSNILELVKDWFEGEASGKWLLVVDNADNMESLYDSNPDTLSDYFPRSYSGSILMTIRYNKVGIKFATSKTTIEVSGLSPDESKQFLNVRLGVITQEDADRKQLAEELEKIPLALVQAVSFIQQNQTTVKCYLQLYQDSDISKIRLLSKEFEDDTRDRESRNPVATTWAVSFNYIREHDTAAADILLHRLVRLAMRNWLRMEDSFVVWTARSIETLAARYTQGFLNTRATWLKYLPHAITLLSCDQLKVEEGPSTVPRAVQKQEATVGHAPDGQICPLCTTKSFLSVARSLLRIGNFNLAGQFAQQGLLIGERVLEDGHSYIHQILGIKANVSFYLYDLSGAANLLRQAIDVGLVNLDPLSEEILDYERNLALALGS